jgi:hypothetical protein
MAGGVSLLTACQSPTDPSETGPTVDEFVEVSVSPDPIIAEASTDGKGYKVVENDVTVTRVYDWKARFNITARLNDQANDEDLDIEWPVDITAATFQPGQATGGIRNAPPAGEVEYSTSEIAAATSNRFGAANTSQTLTIDLWYDFPNLKKEALMVASLSFKDADGKTFTRTAEFRISP